MVSVLWNFSFERFFTFGTKNVLSQPNKVSDSFAHSRTRALSFSSSASKGHSAASQVLNLVLHLRMLPSGMGAKRNPEADGPMLDEQTLLQEMAKAIEEEDYDRAAEIRDALQELHENDKVLVFSANARFYQAFRNGDLAGMRSIWVLEDSVYVVHPGAGRICGYDLVMDSWEILCGADREFPIQIELRDVEVRVSGNVGYVSCVELVKGKGGSWGKQIATNVFKKMHGQWFLCVHHASHIDN